MLDESSEFGRRAARRLRRRAARLADDRSPRRGTPQPVLVWFLWDGEASILVYSRPDTPKLRNVANNPRVSLHLDGNGQGGDAVVCLGEASVSDDPPAHGVDDYVAKYAGFIERNRWSPKSFAADYSVPLRIAITRFAATKPGPTVEPSWMTPGGSEDEAAIRDRAAHADRLVDADRRRVLRAHEKAHARHLGEQPTAEVAHAALAQAPGHAPPGRPRPAAAGQHAASRRTPPP